MTAIKFAAASPHPPIIILKVGQGRERDTRRAIDALEGLAPEPASLWRFQVKRLP